MKIKRPVGDQWRISSPFGDRINPISGKVIEHHNGIDFACPEGTEVRAICDGKIQRTGYEDELDPKRGFGMRIWQLLTTETGEKFGVVYGHLSKIEVQDGMIIKEGEVIGLSGNSGKSTGPHLHIGLRKWDTNLWQEIQV